MATAGFVFLTDHMNAHTHTHIHTNIDTHTHLHTHKRTHTKDNKMRGPGSFFNTTNFFRSIGHTHTHR